MSGCSKKNMRMRECKENDSCEWEPANKRAGRKKGSCKSKKTTPKPTVTKGSKRKFVVKGSVSKSKKASTPSPRKPATATKSMKAKNTGVINKIHGVSYLTHLFSEGFVEPFFTGVEKSKLYSTPLVEKFISFDIITKKIIPDDMEFQYNDSGFGTGKQKDKKKTLMYNDSAHWYKDHKKFNVNDVITDNSGGYSPSEFDAWLVVEHSGKKGLVMFPWSEEYDEDTGFDEGDSINRKGQMIHPITGKLVVVRK